MSVATSFKYHRPFPFCVESKTDSEIDAIASPGGDQLWLRWKGTLAETMGLWWNIESLSLTLYFSGLPYAIPDADLQWADLNLLDNIAVPPRSRACGSVTRYGAYHILIDGGEPLTDIFIGVGGVYYNTTTNEYEVLISFYVNAPAYVIASFYDVGTGVIDPFVADFFGQTLTLYSTDAATNYVEDVVPTFYTY